MARATRSMIPHPPGVKDGDSGWARIREQNARYWPRFSDSEYQRRYREIRKLMAAQGIDCLIMMSSGYLSSANLIYVANYIDILHGVVVFPFEEEPTVFALAYSFAAQAAAQSVVEDVRWGAAINHGAIVDRLREGGFERATIGICDSLPHDMWLYLREALPGEAHRSTGSNVRGAPLPERGGARMVSEGGEIL